jgi:calcium uniporter protein, mitochondrial
VAQDDQEDEGGPLLHERIPSGGSVQEVRWSPSTDLGDFIKQATIEQTFRIVLIPQEGVSPQGNDGGTPAGNEQEEDYDEADPTKTVADGRDHQDVEIHSPAHKDNVRSNELSIKIMIPSFASRTIYLRKQLLHLTNEIQSMTELKKQ